MTWSSEKPGRYSELAGVRETRELREGMDFRRPEFRREVFLRFYEFHLRYRSNPGCVYYLLPYLAKEYGWGMEQKLWFAFLNGNTQNPVTSLLIFRRFPGGPARVDGLENWFRSEKERLAFDTDRRYHRKEFLRAVECYRGLTAGGTQEGFFRGILNSGGFGATWEAVNRYFHSFGRLSAFSYLEYLRIMGMPVECDRLFLEDLGGSKSHRNGLAKVLGRDDLDWHESNPAGFSGGYSREVMGWLKAEGAALLGEARGRLAGEDFAADVGYFTLESCLCTYKSWHRPNRRYPNCYNDMLHDRVRKADRDWPYEDLDVFWEARRNCLPVYLRQEDTLGDPGMCAEKQNYYREYGCPVMMDRDWPCFRNEFNDRLSRGVRS